jgi:hypothetical protein
MEVIPGRLSGRSFTRAVLKMALAAPKSACRASVTSPNGRGDRDVRGKACTHRDGNKTPAALRRAIRQVCAGPPKRIALSWKQAISSTVLACKRLMQGQPTMRGYSYEEVRWQKSVQRIARCDVR